MTVICHPRYVDHLQWRDHPERPERITATVLRMRKECLWEEVTVPEPARRDDLLLVHSEEYVNKVAGSSQGYLDPDTFLRDDTFEISLLSAGGALEAARQSAEHGRPTLALIRPPGHHAGVDYGGGFCYFNNLAIAARYLGRKRTAIVDLDVHHGNGTQGVFYSDPSVLFISTHQYGIYPGTGGSTEVGEGEGRGYTINIPFRSGVGDGSYLSALRRVILPSLDQFDPELLLVSLGVDAHYKDPLASLTLSSGGYLELLGELIEATPSGRIAFILEGGYHLDATAEVLAGLVGIINGREVELEYPGPTDEKGCGEEQIREVIHAQKEFWDLNR